MRAPCREQEVAQAMKVGVRHHGIHELLADALSAMLRKYENVPQPCKCRSIAHDARESHLRSAATRVSGEGGEADRSVDGPLYDLAGVAHRVEMTYCPKRGRL